MRQKIGDPGGLFRCRICFRSFLSNQNGLNHHMGQFFLFCRKSSFSSFSPIGSLLVPPELVTSKHGFHILEHLHLSPLLTRAWLKRELCAWTGWESMNTITVQHCNVQGPKKGKQTEKFSFLQKLFFSQFRLELGRSGGVQGEGMDHTKRFPRTLAGFGLTRHVGEVDFYVFGKYWKLTSSPNTSKWVLGPPDWSSDFFLIQGPISGATK